MHAPPAKPRRFSLRPHTRGPRRRLRRVAMLPALLTLGNLLCGFAAIHFAAKPVAATGFFGWSTLTVAGSLIFFGMFFDAIDGFVARLVKSTSVFGANLDSLADVVSFGVAPAFMMLRLVSHYYGPDGATSIMGPEVDSVYARVAWAIAAVYICCTALRLARFNAEASAAGGEEHRTFFGLPSPGAAGAVASLIVLHQHLLSRHTGIEDGLAFARAAALGIPFVTLIVAFAMVSNVRYSHFVNRVLRSRRTFPSLIRIVLPVVVALWWPRETLAAGFVIYALSGPLTAMFKRGERHRPAHATQANP
ncbi:MAG: CDP-alcohol phosphatidyltransferase family protein [Phycisphaerales bacterium]